MFARQTVVRSAARSAAASGRFAASASGPVRRFAAAAEERVKPPVSVYGLDGTYATALVRLALFRFFALIDYLFSLEQ